MSKPILVILAAGMASRYGSQKQTEGFGPNGETIMDYSIYDAIQSGFGKVVFIIREDFAAAFEPIYNQKLANAGIEIAYVYQGLQKFLNGYQAAPEREKPWGTAHAMLCAGEAIDAPFAIINADDFYGRDAFEKAYKFLTTDCTATNQALIGYELKNTLSENGTVSRGVCEVNDHNELISITERTKVFEQEGQMVYEEEGNLSSLTTAQKASMNFWLFHPSIIKDAEEQFAIFLQQKGKELKSEFFLPILADYLIKSGKAAMHVIPTQAVWFGVTYKEDAPVVKNRVSELVAAGTYPTPLFA